MLRGIDGINEETASRFHEHVIKAPEYTDSEEYGSCKTLNIQVYLDERRKNSIYLFENASI
jgi:hypothetical protein